MEKFKDIKPGDIVRTKQSGILYVIGVGEYILVNKDISVHEAGNNRKFNFDGAEIHGSDSIVCTLDLRRETVSLVGCDVGDSLISRNGDVWRIVRWSTFDGPPAERYVIASLMSDGSRSFAVFSLDGSYRTELGKSLYDIVEVKTAFGRTITPPDEKPFVDFNKVKPGYQLFLSNGDVVTALSHNIGDNNVAAFMTMKGTVSSRVHSNGWHVIKYKAMPYPQLSGCSIGDTIRTGDGNFGWVVGKGTKIASDVAVYPIEVLLCGSVVEVNVTKFGKVFMDENGLATDQSRDVVSVSESRVDMPRCRIGDEVEWRGRTNGLWKKFTGRIVDVNSSRGIYRVHSAGSEAKSLRFNSDGVEASGEPMFIVGVVQFKYPGVPLQYRYGDFSQCDDQAKVILVSYRCERFELQGVDEFGSYVTKNVETGDQRLFGPYGDWRPNSCNDRYDGKDNIRKVVLE